jgi:hypothetical protein
MSAPPPDYNEPWSWTAAPVAAAAAAAVSYGLPPPPAYCAGREVKFRIAGHNHATGGRATHALKTDFEHSWKYRVDTILGDRAFRSPTDCRACRSHSLSLVRIPQSEEEKQANRVYKVRCSCGTSSWEARRVDADPNQLDPSIEFIRQLERTCQVMGMPWEHVLGEDIRDIWESSGRGADSHVVVDQVRRLLRDL